jgi:hypothetical protein
VIGSLDAKSRQASANASIALTKSSEAETKAEAADKAAGKAQEKVGGVDKRADDIDDRLDLALSLVAARSVQHPKDLADKLGSWFMSGEHITLRSYKGDVEGFNLCMELFFLMTSEKLDPVIRCGQEELITQPFSLWEEPPISGMFIRGPDGVRGILLRSILLDDGGMGLVGDINGMGKPQPDWELFFQWLGYDLQKRPVGRKLNRKPSRKRAVDAKRHHYRKSCLAKEIPCAVVC